MKTYLKLLVSSGLIVVLMPTPHLYAQENSDGIERWAEVEIPQPVPVAIKPSGAHGTIIVEGDVLPDRHLANLHVTKSSHSTKLDEYALNLYRKAKIGDDLMGNDPNKIRMTMKFYNAGLTLTDLREYSCSQAVADYDWYNTVAPGEVEKSPLYSFLSVSGTLLNVHYFSFAKNQKAYDQAWHMAIEDCRSQSQANFVKIFYESGKKIKR